MGKPFQTEGVAWAKTQGHKGEGHLEEVSHGLNGECPWWAVGRWRLGTWAGARSRKALYQTLVPAAHNSEIGIRTGLS